MAVLSDDISTVILFSLQTKPNRRN